MSPTPKLQLSHDEWRKKLNPQEFDVLRRAGTERPFVGEYTDTKTEGVYRCRACGAELFRSAEKFESHCGWPSFYQPTEDDAVVLIEDRSLGPDRGPVRPLRLPPRARIRGRRLRRAHGPALVHQLGLPHPGARGRVILAAYSPPLPGGIMRPAGGAAIRRASARPRRRRRVRPGRPRG